MAESSNQPRPAPEPRVAEPRVAEPAAKGRWPAQSMIFNFVLPTLLLCAALSVVWFLGTAQPERRPAADTSKAGRLRALTPVRVQRLHSLEATGQQLQLVVDGSVVPFREARVAAEVAGRVIFKADDCEAGSYVRQDQLLMRIDDTDYKLEVQRLTRLKEQEYQAIGEVDQEMANTRRLIDVAQQDVDLQQKEVDRQKKLPEGFASRAEIDRANRTLLAAMQQLVNAENQLDLLKKRRVRLETSERLAATQLKAAEINLQRTEIRAPIEGVIVAEDADLNTFVTRGSTLVTIEDTSKVEVATNLRMDQLYWVLDQQGKRVDELSRGYDLPETPAIIEYELSGRKGAVYRWNGRLLSYDGIGLDPVSRTVPVRVLVDNPREYMDENGETRPVGGPTALVRGMYVRVKLLIRPQTPLVVIPARALQPGNRVLQFVPDETVLGTATREVSRGAEGEENPAEAAVESSDERLGSFDPSHWQPGRVFVRKSVNPVDSLAVNSEITAAARNSESDFAGANRLWVCETRDPALRGGSFVVVSPLGTIDDGELPARAERKGMTDEPLPNQASDADSTAASSRTSSPRRDQQQDLNLSRAAQREGAG